MGLARYVGKLIFMKTFINSLIFISIWARSSAWIERFPPKEEVEGSNPFGPAFYVISGKE
jgi:hypothetical protein